MTYYKINSTLLGITIDTKLNFKERIDNMHKAYVKQLYNFNPLTPGVH